MLTTEEAAKRLATLHDPRWRDKAAERAAGLPDPLREPAGALLAPWPAATARQETEAHRGRRLAAARAMDQLTAADLTRLTSALHPGLGPAIARWWADARDRPYPGGWYRLALRAPRNPECTTDNRLASLSRFLNAAGPYEADPVWLAIWGAYLRSGRYGGALAPREIGGLLASAIDLGDRGGKETLAALTEIGGGEHPTGLMGRHVIVALLGSSRPEAWDFCERLLLAAQRQEGLRQSVLESVDEAHPAAFDRMAALILDQGLLRFAAAVRAAGVWIGSGADVTEAALVERRLRVLIACRASEGDRGAALKSAAPWDAYLALLAGGMRDVFTTFPEARALLTAPEPGLRAAAVRYAAATSVAPGQEIVAAAVDDPDPGVATLATHLLDGAGLTWPGAFDALARLLSRLPAADREVKGLGVEQEPVTVSRRAAAGRLVSALGARPVADLLPWLPAMGPDGRAAAAARIVSGAGRDQPATAASGGTGGRPPGGSLPQAPLPAELRPVVIGLLTDRSSWVRSIAIRALTATRLDPAEAPAIEALLTRAATDVRRGALTLLASLPPPAARASAARLAAGKVKRQRDAAAELLREIAGKDGAGPGDPADSPADGPGAIADGDADLTPIEDLRVTMTARRSAPVPPRTALAGPRPGPRAARILQALDEVAARHRDEPVTVTNWQGSAQMLFGDVRSFPTPFAPGRGRPARQPGREPGPGSLSLADGMVLGAAFHKWWAGRPDALRGEDDGRDALRCFVLATAARPALGGPVPVGGFPVGTVITALGGRLPEDRHSNWWHDTERRLAGDPPEPLTHLAAVRAVTAWLAAEHASGPVIDECLDAFEATLAAVPPEVLTAVPARDPQLTGPAGGAARDDWRQRVPGSPWYHMLTALLGLRPELFTTARLGRWFGLARWLERPVPQAAALPVAEELLAAAHRAGVATDDDAVAVFLNPGNRYGNPLFKDLTGHWRTRPEARYPDLIPVADRLRDRLVAVEVKRGDLPTPTSANALGIGSVAGVGPAAALLANLGENPLFRGHSWGADRGSRAEVLSHLLRVSFPAPGEAGADLKAAADQAQVSDARLIDLALYAPQWAQPVEEALGWPGLADGVLWLHAHTRDRLWSVDQELRDSWAALAAERTPLTADDLMDGAVDVDWFQRVQQTLGGVRWAVLHAAARHVSNGTGHRRAQLYAEAMLGLVSAGELRDRITGKRYQDAVRALGLLPLPGTNTAGADENSDPAGRAEAIAARYATLREFERGSRAFGAERQANEKTAVRIGVENLARTAGYADPLRFTWAAEAREAGDLADGPVSVTVGDVTVTLSVTEEGAPALAVARKGKALKAVPAALRKDPALTALQGRKADIARQTVRVRASLEAAMTTRDEFTEQDFTELRRHPVVAPMLAKLVWVTADGSTCLLLHGSDGIDAGLASPAVLGPLRIAHPVDLVSDGSWVHWQERLFALGWRQPFKQVFRELYVRTDQERRDSPVSRRYDGHQVQPRQAAALLGARGWVSGYDTGDAARVFHRDRLVARVTFADGRFTPAEAEPPMIDGVRFTRRGEHLAQPLDGVPPVVFSEAMRDLDLVVSVAHAGGVDPEATASTTEMRAALIRETARLLKLENIELTGAHAVIQGRLGEYSLHLGSGTVHRRPGGALCIIPVGAQHRGRLFLPFADDDPKTAEIVAKALLLARDHEIKDPTILEQL